ncbi:MAG: MFS transporter [Bacteroidia bacterium]
MRKTTLLLSSTLTVMSGALIAPALPQMEAAFADQAGAALLTKLVLTVPALVIAFFSPLAGWLIDRFGKIRLFLFSMVLYTIAGSAGYFLEDLYMILASRALLGLAVAMVMTTSTTLIGDYYEGEERNAFIGVQAAFMAFGGTVFISISGLLADYNWRYPFLVYSFGLVVLLLVWRFLPEPERPKKTGDARTEVAAVSLATSQRPWLLLVYFSAFVSMVMFYFIPIQGPYLMQAIGVEKSSGQSLGLIITTLVAAIVAVNFGRLKRYFNFSQLYLVCFGSMVAGFLVVYFFPTYIGILIAMGIAGMGAGLIMPTATTCLMQMAPPALRGRIMGGLTSVIFLGQFVSPLVSQPLVNASSLPQAHLWAAIGVLPLMLVWVFASRKMP